MLGIWESKWLDAALLLAGLVLIVAIVISLNPDREQEIFWENKVADLTGMKVEIESVEQANDGSLIFSNIKVFNHENFSDGDFIFIPKLTSSTGSSGKHLILDIQKPTFNYYHTGSESNAKNFFQAIRSKGYKESFTNNNSYELEVKVTEPEMLVLYSRETGKNHILKSILMHNQQYKFHTEYATLRPEMKSFKLRSVRGSEAKVAAKAGAYFLSKIESIGNEPLEKYENSYKRAAELRRLKEEAYKARRRPKKKKEYKDRFEYKPVRVH